MADGGDDQTRVCTRRDMSANTPEPPPDLPPGWRVVSDEELAWLGRYCPSCMKTRRACECIFP